MAASVCRPRARSTLNAFSVNLVGSSSLFSGAARSPATTRTPVALTTAWPSRACRRGCLPAPRTPYRRTWGRGAPLGFRGLNANAGSGQGPFRAGRLGVRQHVDGGTGHGRPAGLLRHESFGDRVGAARWPGRPSRRSGADTRLRGGATWPIFSVFTGASGGGGVASYAGIRRPAARMGSSGGPGVRLGEWSPPGGTTTGRFKSRLRTA